MKREFDLILYGATGFTGRQAAAYLSAHAPDGLRWAMAGRDGGKLKSSHVRAPAIVASTEKEQELNELAARTQVILNMAGPFKRYGDPIVAACLRMGTDYCDISGETARIRGLIDRHHAEAKAKRVRIVNFCGASSAPADLAVYLLDRKLGGRLVQAKAALSIKGGSFNGGTIASVADAIESGDAAIEADPFLLGPAGRAPEAMERDPTTLRYDDDLRTWTVPSPMGRSDTRAVRRSAALCDRDIVFQEYLAFDGKGAWRAAAGNFALLTAVGGAFRWGVTRRLLRTVIAPGEGPSEKQMDAASFAVRVWGRTSDGAVGEVRIAGPGDPGNRITVKCACACALALSQDRNALPRRFGVLTPAVAIGEVLAQGLATAGLTIEAG